MADEDQIESQEGIQDQYSNADSDHDKNLKATADNELGPASSLHPPRVGHPPPQDPPGSSGSRRLVHGGERGIGMQSQRKARAIEASETIAEAEKIIASPSERDQHDGPES